MEDCIFCKIAQKELPAEIVHETERVIVFADIHPKAPLHLLVIPKKHISTLNDVEENDRELLGELLFTLQKVAKEKQKTDYRVQISVGKEGGQDVFHLHLHLLAN